MGVWDDISAFRMQLQASFLDHVEHLSLGLSEARGGLKKFCASRKKK
jgi:hypothetical protein